ncbi:unnamed protein product [Lathyrus sativus]|nr:unnamed protein product [Lathyrus sativus]
MEGKETRKKEIEKKNRKYRFCVCGARHSFLTLVTSITFNTVVTRPSRSSRSTRPSQDHDDRHEPSIRIKQKSTRPSTKFLPALSPLTAHYWKLLPLPP